VIYERGMGDGANGCIDGVLSTITTGVMYRIVSHE